MKPECLNVDMVTRNRLALERFEGREALFSEGELLFRVRVNDIRAGRRGMSALITVLPTPGFVVPQCWAMQIASVWSTFRFDAYTWRSMYYAPFKLDFRTETIARIQGAMLSLPPDTDSKQRRMVSSSVLYGPLELRDRLLSLLTDESDRSVVDETARQQAALHAKIFENSEGIYCAGVFVARVRITDLTVNERGIWGSATVIPTPSLGVGTTASDSWKIGGCWQCFHIRESSWVVSCAQPSIIRFDPDLVNRIVNLAAGELATIDGGAHTFFIAEFIWSGNEKELAEHVALVRRVRELQHAINDTQTSETRQLGDPFEID